MRHIAVDPVRGLQEAVEQILFKRENLSPQHCLLVGISGIDGSGKGFISHRIGEALQEHGLRVANLNVDGWLNLPHVRFNRENPGEHFYLHAIRFQELFSRLVLPLKKTRTTNLLADYVEETAVEYRKHQYSFTDIDILLLEGIFLFKRQYRAFFDLALWIECSFQTALERAIARSQEGLSPEETRSTYWNIYFPAQKIHFAKDNPWSAVDRIIYNDWRLSSPLTLAC